MICSKFLRQANGFVGHGLKIVQFSENNGKFILNRTKKISYNCHYSTALTSKFSDYQKAVLKPAISLNFTACMSTEGSSEKYQIVFTNPVEGTSTTQNVTLASTNDIKNSEEILLSHTPDLTVVEGSSQVDVATAFAEASASSNEVAITAVADVIEPSLASLGLCNWTPVGLIQMLLEQMHIGMNWPWWLAIVGTTVIARILLFPLLLKTQRSAVNMSNYMPQLQFLQAKFGEARRTGNSMEAAKYANEMMIYMKDKKISPLKTAMLPMMQAPIFLSFFFGLRKMANLPVESMKTGGLWWVTDLTIPDPYYILPVVACGTLYVVLRVGAESGIRMENLKMARYFVQFLPLIVLPFCINFPSAILYYWCANNLCTLGVVSFLKIPTVRQYFNLPIQKPVDPKFSLPKKPFIKGVKDAYEDQKVLSLVEERRRMDTIRFQKSGTGPIPRTYSYDPTKPRPSDVAATANKIMASKQHKS